MSHSLTHEADSLPTAGRLIAGHSGWVMTYLQAKEAPWIPGVEIENRMLLQTLFCYLRMAMAFLPHLQGMTYIKIGSFKINTQDIHFLFLGGGEWGERVTFLRCCSL